MRIRGKHKASHPLNRVRGFRVSRLVRMAHSDQDAFRGEAIASDGQHLAFFIDPSASLWNSITNGWFVVKKRLSDSASNSSGSGPNGGY